MLNVFLERINGHKISDIICIGSINLEDSNPEVTAIQSTMYLEYEFGYLKLESVEQYSKLRLSFSREIECDIELEEDEIFIKYSVATIILKDFLAENTVSSSGVYNSIVAINDLVECEALQIELENEQLIFVDPSYFGIQIGGGQVKRRWLETANSNGKDINYVEMYG